MIVSRTNENESDARHELGLFFHRELKMRYDFSYLCRIPDIESSGLLNEVSEEQIVRVRSFFEDVMYPVGQERKRQDKHMDRIRGILSSSSSIVSLIPRFTGLLWRHGHRLAGVSRAGLNVVSLFQQARKTEDGVLHALLRLWAREYPNLSEARELPDSAFRRAYSTITERELSRTIRLTDRVVRLGSDFRLMEATMDVVQAVIDSADNAEEQAALDYVRSTVHDVQGLAGQFTRRDIENVLKLSYIVEHHYFSRLPEAPIAQESSK